MEDEPAAGGGGVEVLVQRGGPDAAAAQVAHGGDQVLQGAGEPVERGHDERVSGLCEVQAGGELGTVGVAAGLLLGEDPPAVGSRQSAVGGGERVDLALELLPTGRHPGVADADVGEHRRLGGEELGGLDGCGHGHDHLSRRSGDGS